MARTPPAPEDYSSRALLRRTREPVFVLNGRRRIRFVNAAFEQLTRQTFKDLYGTLCTRRKSAEPLAQALSPPPEVLEGSPAVVRRPAPPARLGPPWWDIAFMPFAGEDGLAAIIGRIRVVGVDLPQPIRVLPEPLHALRRQLPVQFSFSGLESDQPACRQAAEQIRLAARHEAPVCIVGESGVGKRTAARIIHHNGLTADRAFLSIDSAALPRWAILRLLDLAASERVGSACVIEPAAMPRELQGQLAERVATRDSGPRWLAISTSEPADDVAAGRLLDELLRAFEIQTIRLVPLRDRRNDIARLAQCFLDRLAQPQFSNVGLSQPVLAILQAYSWPGNLRELESVLCTAMLAAADRPIQPDDLPDAMRRAADPAAAPPRPAPSWRLDDVLAAVERRLITRALEKAGGNKSEAAALLGIWRPRLLRRLQALRLDDLPDRSENGDAPPADRGV